jgi:SAM-dependent methyltransferase
MTTIGWERACPVCRTSLGRPVGVARCGSCGREFRQIGGIWHFLPEERAAVFAPFLNGYQTIRAAEGWGASEIEYYRALPRVPEDDPRRAIWRLRERSFEQLLTRIVQPLATGWSRPLKILDVGSGNGWLADQLARRQHWIAAIDLSIDDRDGLGALPRYSEASRHGSAGGQILPLQAEFDCLPLSANQADLVIFNAALHYSTDYRTTVAEALRVLRGDGTLVLLDSPVYHDAASGQQMLREREASFAATYGTAWMRTEAVGFLTYDALVELATALDLRLGIWQSLPGWRSILRRLKTRVRGQREPAGFPLIVLQPATDRTRRH